MSARATLRRADIERAVVVRTLLIRSSVLSVGLAVIAGLSACASSSVEVQDPQFLMQSRGGQLDRVYKLGIGDKIKVTVFGEDNLSGEFEVNALGQVSMPLVGEVEAQGLALDDFRAALTNKLAAGYLKNPKVSAQILNYRSIFVQGEVKNSGEFNYKNGLRLRDAIAMAGGFTYRADQTYIYIAREGAPEIAVRTPNEIRVLPGDNIRVPERFF